MDDLFDHLWQSIAFAGLAGGLAWLTRRNLAAVRLWIWRIAALKFLLPFGLLFAFGAWIGYPVRHSAIPPPVLLGTVIDAVEPVFAPARAMAGSQRLLVAATILLLLAAVASLLAILRKERFARGELADENARAACEESARSHPPGFFRSAALSGCALCVTASPILAGAVKDRQWRQETLASDTRNLRAARISMSETDHVTARLPLVVATRHDILIHDTNIQDLVALVYGIDQFEVFGGAMPFLESPHYDVRIAGPVREPATFDAYSLREPVTRYLYDRFGVAIRINGSCQDPCANQQSFVIERLR